MSEIENIRAALCRMKITLEDSTAKVNKNRERINQLLDELPENTRDQMIISQCVRLVSMTLDYDEAQQLHLEAEILDD